MDFLFSFVGRQNLPPLMLFGCPSVFNCSKVFWWPTTGLVWLLRLPGFPRTGDHFLWLAVNYMDELGTCCRTMRCFFAGRSTQVWLSWQTSSFLQYIVVAETLDFQHWCSTYCSNCETIRVFWRWARKLDPGIQTCLRHKVRDEIPDMGVHRMTPPTLL